MLADKFVNEAHFAAIERLLKIRDFSDLRHQREDLGRSQFGLRQRREPCPCGSRGPKNFGPLPFIRPVMTLTAEISPSSEEWVFPLPLHYVCWRVRNCSLPVIELFEVPLPLEKPVPLSAFRQTLGGNARAVRMLHECTRLDLWYAGKEGEKSLSPSILCDARKSVVIDCFEMSERFEFLYLSVPELSGAEEASANVDFSWPNAYASALSEAEKQSAFEFHQRRLLPLGGQRSEALFKESIFFRTVIARRRQIGLI